MGPAPERHFDSDGALLLSPRPRLLWRQDRSWLVRADGEWVVRRSADRLEYRHRCARPAGQSPHWPTPVRSRETQLSGGRQRFVRLRWVEVMTAYVGCANSRDRAADGLADGEDAAVQQLKLMWRHSGESTLPRLPRTFTPSELREALDLRRERRRSQS